MSARRDQFRSSFPLLALQIVGLLVPFSAAVSYLVFGPAGWAFFVYPLGLTLALLVVMGIVVLADRISLDDNYQQIKRGWARPLSYHEIKSVRFRECLGLARVSADTHNGKSVLLLLALNTRAKRRLREALMERIPEVTAKTGRRSGLLLVSLLAALLAVLYFGATYATGQWVQAVNTPCSAVSPAANAVGGETVIDAAGMRYTLPDSFRQVPDRHGGVLFEDAATGDLIRVVPPLGLESLGRSARWFMQLAGLRSDFELLRYACCSEFGVVPAVLKAIVVGRWTSPKIYRFDSVQRRALLLGGAGNAGMEFRILVQDQESGAEANLVYVAPRPVPANEVAELLPRIAVSIAR